METEYCECGAEATVFMDLVGDPLAEPMCAHCWGERMAEQFEEAWTDEALDDLGEVVYLGGEINVEPRLPHYAEEDWTPETYVPESLQIDPQLRLKILESFNEGEGDEMAAG